MRNPEQILAYRSLREMVGSDPQQVWSVSPSDTLLTALRLMADKNIGFVVVLQGDALVGVLSERDCVRRMLTAANALDATQVSDIMVRDVVAVDYEHTFADCLRLMHEHRIRHLPVFVVARLWRSSQCVIYWARRSRTTERIIGELERERMTIFTSTGVMRFVGSCHRRTLPMDLLIVLGALVFLMFVAYRGYSVILFAPVPRSAPCC